MARPDRDALESTLEALRSAGVLREWHRRPLGIYWLVLPDGQKITPDTKETAMWATGASAAMLVSTPTASASDFDPDEVSDVLDGMRRSGVIDAWRIDADGDYEFEARDQHFWMRPHELRPFTYGALISEEAKEQPDMDPDQVSQVLDGLRTIGAVVSWRIDEGGNYEISPPGDEVLSIGPWRIGAFVSGAVAVYRAGTSNESSEG